jgi:hypothetical protein
MHKQGSAGHYPGHCWPSLQGGGDREPREDIEAIEAGLKQAEDLPKSVVK